MTPYTRAWRNCGLMLVLMLATPLAVGLLASAVGDWSFLAAFLAWIPLAF